MKLKNNDTETGRHLLVAKLGPKYMIFLSPTDDNNLTYHIGLLFRLNKLFHMTDLKTT